MRAAMHETSPDSRTTKAMVGGMTLLLLQIVIPVALANLVEALTITGYLPAFSLLDVPLYGWAVAANGSEGGRTMALTVTAVPRNLATKVTFLYLEFDDLFAILVLAVVMNMF